MKSIRLLFIAVLLFSGITNAQITKGNWMVGGDASFDNTTLKNKDGEILGSGNGVRIYPNIGYFFLTKFAAGINANFNYNKTSGASSTTGYGVGPFVRYYFLKPEKIVNVFAEANYNYYKSYSQGESTTNSSSYRFKAGPVIYFNSSVGLELTLNYSSAKLETYTSNYFNVSLGFQIHLEK
jgi:hypothetical protein